MGDLGNIEAEGNGALTEIVIVDDEISLADGAENGIIGKVMLKKPLLCFVYKQSWSCIVYLQHLLLLSLAFSFLPKMAFP